MATRLRIRNPATVYPLPFTPAFDALWTHTGSAQRTLMYEGLWGSAFLNSTIAETSLVQQHILHQQMISPPLQAQSISGNFSFAIRSWTSNIASGMRPQIVIRVIAPDGTVRGTLYAGSTTFGQAYSTGARVNSAVATAMTTVNALDGDYLVAEIGSYADNVVATSYNSLMQLGDPIGETDLPFTQGSTAADAPWLEFANTISFKTKGMLANYNVEALATPDDVDTQLAQLSVEAMGTPSPVEFNLSRITTEVMGIPSPVTFDMSRFVAEVMGIPSPISMDMSRLLVEVLGVAGEPPGLGLQFVMDGTPIQAKFPGLGWVELE